MEKMIGPRRPFYKAGPVMRLEKIPRRRLRRRSSRRDSARAAFAPRPASARRSSISPATCPTTCSGSRTRPGTTSATAGGRRATLDTPARDAGAAARRAGDDLRGGLAAADAGAARACCAPSCCRTDASCSRPTRARAIGWADRRASRHRSTALVKQDLLLKEGNQLRRRRFAAARVGRAENVLSVRGQCAGFSRASAWTVPSCAPGRCTTGRTRRSGPRSSWRSFRRSSATTPRPGSRRRWPRAFCLGHDDRRHDRRAHRHRSWARSPIIRALKKTLLGGLHADRRRRDAADGDHRRAATGCTRARCSCREHRRRVELRVLRLAAAAHRRAGRDRSRLDGRLRHRVHLAAACCCWSTWRGFSRRRAFGLADTVAAIKLSFVSVGVWWLVFSIPLFRRVPRAGTRARRLGREPARQLRSAAPSCACVEDVPRAARLPQGVPDARRVPALQRRHPDDHPDGVDLRRRDRHRSERADRRVRPRAVRRRAVLVPVRRGGRTHRREARSSSRSRSTSASACSATS